MSVKNAMGFHRSSVVKESAYNAGDLGSIPRLGRSPGEVQGNPLQFSCLENPMDRGAWRATFHGVPGVGHDLVTKSPPRMLQRTPLFSDKTNMRESSLLCQKSVVCVSPSTYVEVKTTATGA